MNGLDLRKRTQCAALVYNSKLATKTETAEERVQTQ